MLITFNQTRLTFFVVLVPFIKSTLAVEPAICVTRWVEAAKNIWEVFAIIFDTFAACKIEDVDDCDYDKQIKIKYSDVQRIYLQINPSKI